MSMFQCEVCGCRENTAAAMQGFRGLTEFYDWSYAPERKGKLLCSACGPTNEASGAPSGYGKWHGLFERVFLPLGMFVKGPRGSLMHKETGDENYRAYAIPPPPEADAQRESSVKNPAAPADLSEGEKAILRRLEKRPIELYWGRSGWVPDGLPKPAKRADFDRICKRDPALVEIRLAKLVLATNDN